MKKMNLGINHKLSSLAKASDEAGILLPEQLAIIYKEKWFKIFVPEENNGLGLSLAEGLAIEEELAKIDGSLGWTVTLCSGATQFIGFLPKEITGEIFQNEKVCFGGSGAITGTATEIEDGYIINGFWKYATGSPYCTHFTANCFIEKNGVPLLNEKGEKIFQSFLFKRDEVKIHKDWNTMGLKATASDSFSVDDLHVSKKRTFIIDGKTATIPGMIYQYPFLQFAETTLAVNMSGMALHFLESFSKLIIEWEQSKKYSDAITERLQDLVEEKRNLLQESRILFYDAVNRSWKILEEENIIPEKLLAEISQLSRNLSRTARNAVAELYPHCGVAATQNGTEINLIFRDLFTASQHYLLNAK